MRLGSALNRPRKAASRALAALLALSLLAASTPAEAISKAAPELGVEVSGPLKLSPPVLAPALTLTAPAALTAIATIPSLPAALSAALEPAARGQKPLAVQQLGGALPSERRSEESAATATFDGALAPKKDLGVVAAAGTGLLPFALKVPSLGAASYAAANVLSVAFPMPQIYKTYVQGHARAFPVARAALGAFGTMLLGLVNASVLDKPFWGAMHVFIGLGLMAPYVIGKYLERKNAGERRWVEPSEAAAQGRVTRALARLKGDGALRRTLLVALPMLAASIGLYAGAAAVIPHALSAALSPRALDDLLLGLQLFKAALFMAVFAPDIVALVRGRAPRGFTMGFNLVFFASVASFTAWGFTAAGAEAAGPIRDQYLVMALRNLGESAASALSILALWRSERAAKNRKP